MGVDDREGAAAAAEYYLRLLEYAQATGDVRQLESMSGADCAYCQSQLASIDARTQAGAWIETEPATLSDLLVQFPEAGGSDYIVTLALESPSAAEVSAEGTLQEWPAETLPNFTMAAGWQADGFIINAVDSDTDD